MTVSGRLFDADGTDQAVEVIENLVAGITDRQLLWVDVDVKDLDELPRCGKGLWVHLRVTSQPAQSHRTSSARYVHWLL